MAVRNHEYEYLTFSAEIEDPLKREFRIKSLNRASKDLSLRQPIQAIVEGLILEDEPLTDKVADKILRDLKKMRSARVDPGHIRPRNYNAGLLVGISIARTTPHVLFDIRGSKAVTGMKNIYLYI